MRSTAGIVAGLLLVGLAANCGGNDSNGGGTAGSTNAAGQGQGGEGTTTAGTGGSTAGTTMAMAGQGGAPTPAGCTKNADCGANATCVDTVCKKNDGQACDTGADCLNTCIDKLCTSKLDDGKACTADTDCAHTCIDGTCAPVSDIGGDCDIDLGAGGAGGAGAGGNSSVGAGGAPTEAPPNPDCKAPLQCFSGKCLTPDGEACLANPDCVSGACIKSVCAPKSTLDGPCDDKADCAVAALVCDETSATCKLDLLQQCAADDQCKTQRCICSDANCTVRTCKNPPASCLCKWSPSDSAVCNVNSANLNSTVQDPEGCLASDGKYCNKGQCVVNAGGSCVNNCTAGTDAANNPTCTPAGATGCNIGYHPVINTACAYNKGVCGGTCTCTLD